MSQTAKSKDGTHVFTPRVAMPLAEARELKAQIAREGLTLNGLVLDLTRQWLAARTQQKTPPTGEGA